MCSLSLFCHAGFVRLRRCTGAPATRVGTRPPPAQLKAGYAAPSAWPCPAPDTGTTPSRRQGPQADLPRAWASAEDGCVTICHYGRPNLLRSQHQPGLGVPGPHQEVHRCALRRLFRPALGETRPARILLHPKRCASHSITSRCAARRAYHLQRWTPQPNRAAVESAVAAASQCLRATSSWTSRCRRSPSMPVASNAASAAAECSCS